jgi:hypothetical protein
VNWEERDCTNRVGEVGQNLFSDARTGTGVNYTVFQPKNRTLFVGSTRQAVLMCRTASKMHFMR